MTRSRRLARFVHWFFLGLLILAATANASAQRTNFALASNGGVATASSQPEAAATCCSARDAIDGNRSGLMAGAADPRTRSGWFSSQPGPQWWQVEFRGSKTIDEIDVFSSQDDGNAVQPDVNTMFTQRGLTGFDVQYWNGGRWVTIPGGNVTGNNRIWRQFTFAPIRTTKIRVWANSIPAHSPSYTSLAQVEAWGDTRQPTGPSATLRSPVDISAPNMMPPVGPGAGYYKIVAVDSFWCLGYRAGGGARVPYLSTSRCDQGGDSWTPLIVVPRFIAAPGEFVVTLRSPDPFVARGVEGFRSLNSCVTMARGVIDNSPRGVDLQPCDPSPGGNWEESGAPDQLFVFRPGRAATLSNATDVFAICNFADPLSCMDVRGASHDVNTDLIMWQYNGNQNQLFRFLPIAAGFASDAASYFNRLSYLEDPGHIFWRAQSIDGWDLIGQDGGPGIPQSPINVSGALACAQACAANAACSAFTWVRANSGQGPDAHCWLKGKVPTDAVVNRNASSGVVRPNFAPQPPSRNSLETMSPLMPTLVGRNNVALASNGATATASTTLDRFSPGGAIDGDYVGTNWTLFGGWQSAAPSFPADLVIDFHRQKTIYEIDVFTLQDDYSHPAVPTEDMTFSLFGLADYEVQYLNPTGQWQTFVGGNITGNNRVWRRIILADVGTSKIRVLTHRSVDGFSRIVEVQAYARN